MIEVNLFYTYLKITLWNVHMDVVIHRPFRYWKKGFHNYNDPWYRRIPWKLIEIERHWPTTTRL